MISLIGIWGNHLYPAEVDKDLLAGRRESLRLLLRELREERGVRQVDLAAKLGVPQSHVSKYETGERRVEFVMLEAICSALEVSLEEFLSRWQEE